MFKMKITVQIWTKVKYINEKGEVLLKELRLFLCEEYGIKNDHFEHCNLSWAYKEEDDLKKGKLR